MKYSEAIKFIRAEAAAVGLTLRKSGAPINGKQYWELIDRATKETMMTKRNFWTFYEDACNGYIARYNKKTMRFEFNPSLGLASEAEAKHKDTAVLYGHHERDFWIYEAVGLKILTLEEAKRLISWTTKILAGSRIEEKEGEACQELNGRVRHYHLQKIKVELQLAMQSLIATYLKVPVYTVCNYGRDPQGKRVVVVDSLSGKAGNKCGYYSFDAELTEESLKLTNIFKIKGV